MRGAVRSGVARCGEATQCVALRGMAVLGLAWRSDPMQSKGIRRICSMAITREMIIEFFAGGGEVGA